MIGIVLAIIGIIAGAACLISGIAVKDKFSTWFGLSILIINILFLVKDITERDNVVPAAMDVYQGKTTLEYTYRDGIAIDSIVVWKEGINE